MTETAIARWEQYNEAGRRSFSQGQFAEAEEYYQAASREAETLGAESPQLATTLNALGQLRLHAKDLAAAEQYLARALAIREKVYGEHHALVSSLNNLGALYDAKGEMDAAESALTRALTICENQLQPGHPDLALALNNLSRLCFKRRDFSRADRLLLRLLDIKRALGKDHPEVANVLGALAKLRHAVGRNDQAEQLWRQALAIRERAFAPGDVLIATTLESLADCCAPQRGRIADAIAHRERALEIRIGASGAHHPSVTAARDRLEALKRRASGEPQEPAAPPPPRSSYEVPKPVTSQEIPTLGDNRTSGGSQLPWLDVEPQERERVSQQIELASVEPQVPPAPPAPSPIVPPPVAASSFGPPPVVLAPIMPPPMPAAAAAPVPPQPIAPTPPPAPLFAAPAPPPRDLGISEGFAPPPEPRRPAPPPPRRSLEARPAPRRSSGERPAYRVSEPTPRAGGFRLGRLVTPLFLLALTGGGWVAWARGYVHPLTLLSRVFETVASHAPAVTPAKASASPAPRVPAPPVPEIVVPESLVSASARDGGTTDSLAGQPRDTTPDDGLHPRMKVDVEGPTGSGAREVDALSSAIDRSTQAKLDSVERARLAAKLPVIRKP